MDKHLGEIKAVKIMQESQNKIGKTGVQTFLNNRSRDYAQKFKDFQCNAEKSFILENTCLNIKATMRTLLHVGFGHSGTKSLQLNIFKKTPAIFYVGIPLTHYGGILSNIKYLEDEDYSAPQMLQEVENEIFKKRAKNQLIVISDETLVEQPLIKNTPAMMPTGLIAKRLSELFDKADILFTIRNQFSYISSAYRVLKENRATDGSVTDEFGIWFKGQFSQTRNLFLRNIDYLKTINIYKKYFPSSKITLLPLEIITLEGFNAYKKELQKILYDVDLSSFKQESYPIQNKSIKQKSFIDEETKAKIKEICGASNRELQKTVGLPLEKYGYPIV